MLDFQYTKYSIFSQSLFLFPLSGDGIRISSLGNVALLPHDVHKGMRTSLLALNKMRDPHIILCSTSNPLRYDICVCGRNCLNVCIWRSKAATVFPSDQGDEGSDGCTFGSSSSLI